MYKFFVDQEQFKEDMVTIIGKDVNHIKNVLRFHTGDDIIICNKQSEKSFICCIQNIDSTEIDCCIVKEETNTTEPITYIHLFQGLPKADKMEWIIEKCTEIGLKEITPIIMHRSIVQLNEKDKIKKVERWRKIAEIASKQSQRDSILKVNAILTFKNIFQKLNGYDIVLVAYEKENQQTLKNILSSFKNKKQNFKIAIIVGPEGGITEEEIEICKSNHVIPITLGRRILRTETAPIVLVSNVLYELEEEN